MNASTTAPRRTARGAPAARVEDPGFSSILFHAPETPMIDGHPTPDCFEDLNLDQIVEAIVAGREEYALEPYFNLPLADPGAIRYRHEALRDLEDGALRARIEAFAQRMGSMRRHRRQAEKLRYRYQQERWLLEAMRAYCEAVEELAADLARADLRSAAFIGLREYFGQYAGSGAFVELRSATSQLLDGLARVRYALHIRGNRIAVRAFEDERDYSTEVLRTFEKFRQASAREHTFDFPSRAAMNHIEEAVHDRVVQRNPELFAQLDAHAERHADYLDPTVARFDREVQLYLAVLEQAERLRGAGLDVCYPAVSDRSKEIRVSAGFDLALANGLIAAGAAASVVPNDIELDGGERILVVTGPNNGGKTTFARMFGQLHYLASLGLPVPGREARLFLGDHLFTHFEREEEVEQLRGKLEDDLLRIRAILDAATGNSIVVMNESLASTTASDAAYLGRQILARIIDRDLLCVFVTFIDELAELGSTVVSMVGGVDPRDPVRRTFRIERRPANGRAYAEAIARKHGLTYDGVRQGLAS